jgi:hypothetical protein
MKTPLANRLPTRHRQRFCCIAHNAMRCFILSFTADARNVGWIKAAAFSLQFGNRNLFPFESRSRSSAWLASRWLPCCICGCYLPPNRGRTYTIDDVPPADLSPWQRLRGWFDCAELIPIVENRSIATSRLPIPRSTSFCGLCLEQR